MEAYGMLVLEVCKANGLKYYYGSDKMAYNACFLVKDKRIMQKYRRKGFLPAIF